MRESTFLKRIAVTMAVLILCETIVPSVAMALTSGPTQPEFSGFTSIGVDEVVDHFSGDLNYSIPLMDVPGPHGSYPLTLTYNSEVKMESEASMVGYGWNLNIGQISRSVAGVPDDFDGESIRTFKSIRPNWTAGISPGFGWKFVNLNTNLGLDLTFKYNNYKGFGCDVGVGLQFNPNDEGMLSGSFRANVSSFDGSKWSGGVSLGVKTKGDEDQLYDMGLSIGGNTLTGLQNLNFNHGIGTHSVYAQKFPIFIGEQEYFGPNYKYGFTGGVEIPFFNLALSRGSVFYSRHELKNNNSWVKQPAYGYLHSSGFHSREYSIADYVELEKKPIIEQMKNLGSIMATKDVFNVSTAGLRGAFTGYRSDVGIFSSPISQSETVGVDLSVQVGTGGTANIGAQISMPFSTGGNRFRANGDVPDYKFQNLGINNPLEESFFKFKNEKTAEIQSSTVDHPIVQDYNYIDNDRVIQNKLDQVVSFPLPSLNRNFEVAKIEEDVMNDELNTVNIENGLRSSRKPRTKNIEYYTNEQITGNSESFVIANSVRVGNHINPGQGEPFNEASREDLQLMEADRSFGSDKISAMSVVDESGMRWNFDLPVVNHLKRDVAYSVSKQDEEALCQKNVYGSYSDCTGGPLSASINHEVSEPGVESENLLSITETPAYASNYLLTSQLGYNFVDLDENGPDQGDFGHWVRFDYIQTQNSTTPYSWRMPFHGGVLNVGGRMINDDDKGSFVYGQRDQYYIEKIETSTHIAFFDYEPRNDGRGVDCWLGDSENLGEFSYRLREIRLVSKAEVDGEIVYSPIKSIKLEHTYELWPDVPNNPNSGEGKLTLSELRVLNYSNTRGELTPYRFQYFMEDCCSLPPPGNGEDPPGGGGGDPPGGGGGDKPGDGDGGDIPQEGTLGLHSYSQDEQILDRWGMLMNCSPEEDDCKNLFAPYTPQGDGTVDGSFDQKMDCLARQFHLKSVRLPSGATLRFDVGRDHYSHLENRLAGEMVKIAGFETAEGPDASNIPNNEYSSGQAGRVYFELSKPVEENDPLADVILRNYISDLYEDTRGKQVYFKVLAEYLSEFPDEYVDGYAYIAKNASQQDIIEYDDSSLENGYYHRAYIELQPETLPTKSSFLNGPTGSSFHPILIVGWQILKNSYSKILFEPNFSSAAEDGEVRRFFGELENMLGSFLSIFKGYYKACQNGPRCGKVDLSHSYLRLCNADFKKYGDGVRVTKVAMSNFWEEELVPHYGFVYSYEKEHIVESSEGQTEIIGSSGVASNEPQIGSEENSYKYVENYRNNLKHNTTRQIFNETPVNSALLPGATVGYSKVTVRSLASDYYERILGEDGDEGNHQNIHGIDSYLDELSSSGKVEYEFYTAEEFPTIFKRSTLASSPFKPSSFFLLLASISVRGFKGTQGYVTLTNDMHGKLKSKSSYSQRKNGQYSDLPVNQEQYFYKTKESTVQEGIRKRSVKVLDNIVDVHLADVDPNDNTRAHVEEAEMGVTRDVYSAHDEYFKMSGAVGIDIAAELDLTKVIVPLFAVPAWFNINMNIEDVETTVFNKIVHKSGIVDRVVVRDAQSQIETKHTVYDPYSGSPIVSETQDLYNQPKFTYNIPAYQYYRNFQPSYRNWALSFNGTVSQDDWDECTDMACVRNVDTEIIELLSQGDILSFSGKDGNDNEISGRASFDREIVSVEGDCVYLQFNNLSKGDFPNDDVVFEFNLFRPYKRNRLSLTGQSIMSKLNPIVGYGQKLIQATRSDGSNQSSPYLVPTLNGVIQAEARTYCDFNNANTLSNDMLFRYLDEQGNSPRELGELHNLGYLGIYEDQYQMSYIDSRANDLVKGDFYRNGILNEVPLMRYNEYQPLSSNLMENWVIIEDRIGKGNISNNISSRNIGDVHTSILSNFCINSFDVDGLSSAAVRQERATAKCLGGSRLEMAYNSFEPYEVDYLYNNSNTEYTGANNFGQFDFFQKYNRDYVDYEIYQVLGRIQSFAQLATNKEYLNYPRKYNDVVFMSKNANYDRGYHVNEDVDSWSYTFQATCGWDNQQMTMFDIPVPEECATFIGEPATAAYIALGNSYPTVPNFQPNPCSDDIAHTGNRSLKVTQPTTFNQQSTRLFHDREYVFSCWVNDNSQEYIDLKDAGVQVMIDQSKGNGLTLEPEGQRIEGWQRIEGVFTANANNADELVTEIRIDPGSTASLYIDDVRIYPLGAKMESYVYDYKLQRISHVLDENNYYTEFIYDSEGTLVAINKETKKGIRTIEEQRKFVSHTE